MFIFLITFSTVERLCTFTYFLKMDTIGVLVMYSVVFAQKAIPKIWKSAI